jgi:LuxR family maltose regulon positive regulatory protein
MGDAAGALNSIGKARRAAASSLSPWIAARVAAAEAWLRLKQGDAAAAARWASLCKEKAGDYDACAYWSACLLKARVLAAQGRLAEASGLLVEVSDVAEAAGGNHYLIASLVLQAIVLQSQGRRDQAVAVLEPALSLAGPEGYVRVFISEGEPAARLLRESAARGIPVEYVGSLLAAWAEETARRSPEAQQPPSPHLVEALTDRELEVLRLLAAGLTNREIGDQLFLAVGTVKRYTSTVYGKLRVHSRTQAVARARGPGLL